MTLSMRQAHRRCGRCALRLDAVMACPDCAERAFAFDGVAAACDYAAPADALVMRFKAGAQWLLAPALAHLMAQATLAVHGPQVSPCLPMLPALWLTPVPARAESVRIRGFSPAAELARCLARDLGAVHAPGLLRRIHDGARQTHASRRMRLLAVQHDFHCAADLRGREVAIVDDVMTTGSTLHHAAKCLRDAGAERVWGIVLARTPMRRYPEGC